MSWRDHAAPVGAALIMAWMFVMGTPGLDLVGPRSAKQRAVIGAQPFGGLALAAIDLNTKVRRPIVEPIAVLQRPLGLAQEWNLYAGGPDRVVRLEILIDDRVVYRSADPDATWLRSELRYRRLRPIAAGLCRDGKHSDGLRNWALRRAREDFPDAETVTFRCPRAPWPGRGAVPPRGKTLRLRAPS